MSPGLQDRLKVMLVLICWHSSISHIKRRQNCSLV